MIAAAISCADKGASAEPATSLPARTIDEQNGDTHVIAAEGRDQ